MNGATYISQRGRKVNQPRSNPDRESYGNSKEDAFAQLARKRGWHFTKRGWPDFLCCEEGKWFAVEVKPRLLGGEFKALKRSQIETMAVLESVGIPCYVSDGNEMQRFQPHIHGRGVL
jgi:hypothetical protein